MTMTWIGYKNIEDYQKEITRLREEVRKRNVIIDKYNEAAQHLLDAPPGYYFDGDWDELTIAYRAAQDTSTMTGTTEE